MKGTTKLSSLSHIFSHSLQTSALTLMLLLGAGDAECTSRPSLVAANPPPQPAAIYVTGSVKEILPQQRFHQSEISYHFTLGQTDGKWQINIRAVRPMAAKIREFDENAIVVLNPSAETIYGEGQQFFVVQSYLGYDLMESGKYLGSYDAPNDVAAFGSGKALHGVVSKVGIALWYMFLSADYLNGSTEGQLHALRSTFLHSPKPEDVPREVPARWDLLEPGGLPKMMVISNAPGGSASMQSALIRRMQNVPHTNVLFQVTATTNAFGHEFPTEARIQYYRHQFSNKEHHVETEKTIFISVDSLATPADYPIQKPAITRATRIYDQRFWTSNPPAPVSIIMSNAWPTYSMLSERYVERLDFEQARAVRPSIGWLLLSAVILCAPLLLWKLMKARV